MKVSDLIRIIQENLRIQKSGAEKIQYIDSSGMLAAVGTRQNHVIFARRGCGKTLLLETSESILPKTTLAVYINCEDYKNHSFPNVIIEILNSALLKIEEKIPRRWFIFRNTKAKKIIENIISDLSKLRSSPDEQNQLVKETSQRNAMIGAQVEIKSIGPNASLSADSGTKEEVEKTYSVYDNKKERLTNALPDIKRKLRDFFDAYSGIRNIYLHIDDFYHLPRDLHPYVADYIHRFCKDLPIYFKIATLRHASTLFIERKGQPIGAQERNDFQPLDIDFTLEEFKKTEEQIKRIFYKYGELAGGNEQDINNLFKGDGLRRLILAGGGVPRDCLSLFLEAMNHVLDDPDSRISKDEIRNLSLSNHERRMRELKEDSQKDEATFLIRGIYAIREFCFGEKSNIFVVSEKLLQDNENIQKLINRLSDLKIIHTVQTAFSHKSQQGTTFRAFMIDIGYYANMRKLHGKMNEIDLAASDAKEKIRSTPILTEIKLQELWKSVPKNPEEKILEEESPISA